MAKQMSTALPRLGPLEGSLRRQAGYMKSGGGWSHKVESGHFKPEQEHRECRINQPYAYIWKSLWISSRFLLVLVSTVSKNAVTWSSFSKLLYKYI